MLLFQPLFLAVLLAVTPIYSKPCLNGLDIETRANRASRELLAKPQFKPRAVESIATQTFQLQNIYTNTFSGVTGDILNRSISFSWADTDSNSSTICTTQWLDSTSVNNATGAMSGANNYPSAYTFCGNSNPSFETWQWCFSSMTSLGSFQLTLNHAYYDSDFGSPPDNLIHLTATYNASLTCTTKSGYQGCYLPTAQSPAIVAITGASLGT